MGGGIRLIEVQPSMVRRNDLVMICDEFSVFKDSVPQGWQVAPLL